MTILKWLEGLRAPWLDSLMSAVTELGDETVFMVAGLVILWCVNKRWGFRFLLTGLMGSVMNQLLKAIFLIPRPWVLDPSFTIVESARAGATGYSFPADTPSLPQRCSARWPCGAAGCGARFSAWPWCC